MVRTGDLFFELFDDPVAVADPTTIITQYEFQQTFILTIFNHRLERKSTNSSFKSLCTFNRNIDKRQTEF